MRYFWAGCWAWFMLWGLSLAGEDAPPKSNPAKSITWEVVIVEAPEMPPGDAAPTAKAILAMETADKTTFSARLQLTGLENQKASLNFGELTPVVHGWTMSTVGRTFPSYSSMSLGTQLTVVSRIATDGAIVTDLKLTRSSLSPPEPPADPGSKMQSVTLLTVEATVQGQPGEPLLVTGRRVQKGSQPGQTWVVLTASTGPVAPSKSAAPSSTVAPIAFAPSPPELRAFYLRSAAAKQTAVLLQQVFAGQPPAMAPEARLRPVPRIPHPRPAASTVLTTLREK